MTRPKRSSRFFAPRIFHQERRPATEPAVAEGHLRPPGTHPKPHGAASPSFTALILQLRKPHANVPILQYGPQAPVATKRERDSAPGKRPLPKELESDSAHVPAGTTGDSASESKLPRTAEVDKAVVLESGSGSGLPADTGESTPPADPVKSEVPVAEVPLATPKVEPVQSTAQAPSSTETAPAAGLSSVVGVVKAPHVHPLPSACPHPARPARPIDPMSGLTRPAVCEHAPWPRPQLSSPLGAQ